MGERPEHGTAYLREIGRPATVLRRLDVTGSTNVYGAERSQFDGLVIDRPDGSVRLNDEFH
jgi:hypothetical protein